MKRYDIYCDFKGLPNQEEHVKGEWVKAEIAEELLEALEKMVAYCHKLEDKLLNNRLTVTDIYVESRHERPAEDYADEAIAKAKGE